MAILNVTYFMNKISINVKWNQKKKFQSYAIIEKFSKFRKCLMSNDNSNFHVFVKQILIWSSPYISNLNQRIFLFGRACAILWGKQIQLVWFRQQTLCMEKIKLGAACQKHETHREVWCWVGNGLGIIFLIWAFSMVPWVSICI